MQSPTELAGWQPSPTELAGWQALVSFFTSLESSATPFARSLTLSPARFAELDAHALSLTALVGMEAGKVAMVKLVLVLLLAYPASALVRMLRPVAARHAAAAITGVLLAQWLFGAHWVNLLVSSGVAYALLAVARAMGGSAARCVHGLIVCWVLAYLLVVHAWRLQADYLGWSVAFDGPQMVLTIKLWSLAFCLVDGTPARRAKYAAAAAAAEAAGDARGAASLRGRLRRAQSELPSPLAFASYVFHPATFFAGPALEFSDYSAALEARGGEAPALSAALRKLLPSLFFLGCTVAAAPLGMGVESMLLPRAYPGGLGLLAHLARCHAVMFFARCKYFFGWLAAEGAGALAGFAAAAHGGGARNIDLPAFELARSTSGALRAWNVGAQSWLARYCYERAPLPRGGRVAAVYALSALWHGFYPGYYLAFASMPILQLLEAELAARVQPRLQALLPARLAAALTAAAVAAGISYFMVAFQLLSLERTLVAWAHMGYAGHAVMAALLLALPLLPHSREARGKDGARKGKEGKEE